jgi:STE24 endopeptidase
MQAFHVSLAFCTVLLLSLAIKLWLASRQMRHVHAHRAQVPAPFDATIPLDAHQRAADYTIARTRFGMLSESFRPRCWSAGPCWAAWTP